MVAKKKVTYEPTGDDLNFQVAFSQAAVSLDVAAALAVDSNNVDAMTTVAALWIQMGERLLTGRPPEQDDDEEEESELDSTPRYPIGFSPTEKEEVTDE